MRELEERERKESKKLADEDALRKIRVAEETIEHLQKKLAATKQVFVSPHPQSHAELDLISEKLNIPICGSRSLSPTLFVSFSCLYCTCIRAEESHGLGTISPPEIKPLPHRDFHN